MIYAFAIIFIFSEFYVFLNRDRLFSKVDMTNYKSRKKIICDVIFFLTNILSVVWIAFGLFTPYKILFLVIVLSRLFKLTLFKINKKTLVHYDILKFVLNMVVLSIIFSKFFL